MVKWAWLGGVLVFLIVLTACGAGNTGSAAIEARDAWARAATAMGAEGHGGMATPAANMEMEMGSTSAAYMILHNNGSTADRLVGVESDVAEAAELHISEMNGDVMTMRPIAFVEVPADGEAELKPGGMHIMLIGLKRDLKAGEKIALTLVFENAGRIDVKAEVRAP
jgi:copper(I)-binding protein